MSELISQNLENNICTQPEHLTNLKTAYDYLNRLSFTINGTCNKTVELLAGNAVCLLGDSRMINLMLTKIAIHSLLPKKYGGFSRNSKVFILDAGNCTDVYQFVDFMKQYGLDTKKTLRKIMVSRVFTVYQLTHFLKYELSKAIREYKSNMVIIPDLLSMLVQEPDINIGEVEFLLTEITEALKEIPVNNKVLLISSISLDDKLCQSVLTLGNKVFGIFNKCIEVDKNKTNDKFEVLIQGKQGIEYVTVKKYMSLSSQDILTVTRR